MSDQNKNITSETGKRAELPVKIKRVSDAVALGIFIFIIFLPITLLAATGRVSSPLSFEAEAKLPEASISNYLDGTMTTGFQDWYAKSWPLRSTLVLTYNKIIYDIENIGASDAGNIDKIETPPSETGEETIEPAGPSYLDFNPLYAEINRLRIEQEMVEPTGYRGTDQVVIGKSGYLYENGYINEYYGYSKMYRTVTKETINEQVEKLEYIQNKLAERGIAFVLVFTPSKASQYPDAIPEWYKAANNTYDDYVRPFTMMLERLGTSSVNYIDSAALYKEVGLQDTFPKTGIHWSKAAAFETIKAIIASYEKQTGVTIRHITADTLNKSDNPPGFGNPEQDIFGLVYSTRPNAKKIVDDFYYWPEIYVENPECTNRITAFIQGGSFTHDLNTYLPMYKVTKKIRSVYYNQNEALFASESHADKEWNKMLGDCNYVILECNEQNVRNFGGNAPRWAQADKEGYPIGDRVYESLYNYLQRNG